MKNVLKSKIVWASAALVLSLGIVGCNIFNPTESVNIKSDDAAALSYEGYIKFRDNEYSEAEELRSLARPDEVHPQPKAELQRKDQRIFATPVRELEP